MLTKKKVKLSARERRQERGRKKVRGLSARPRLSIFKSSKHTYAQLICDESGKTLAAASTLDKEVQGEVKQANAAQGQGDKARQLSRSTKGVLAARVVGQTIAKRAIAKSITAVVYDKGGFAFHGRIKAVADGARAGGLKF